eukprot:TRINITY_DN7540_c0_g1_i1.p1 TRINITY_DN7540_c0_g1~~TRINITY_DN7540_c0_g1_i1.p1  ORF type:complete len:854 (-),score=224.99 TRINITY_DN7540_c0_g1_i1:182-2743(-)
MKTDHQTTFVGHLSPCQRGGNDGGGDKDNHLRMGDRTAFFVPLDRRAPRLLVNIQKFEKLVWQQKLEEEAEDMCEDEDQDEFTALEDELSMGRGGQKNQRRQAERDAHSSAQGRSSKKSWRGQQGRPGHNHQVPYLAEETLNTHLFVAEFDEWPISKTMPHGSITEDLGPWEDPDTQKAAVIAANQVPGDEFSADVMNSIPVGWDWTPTEQVIKERRDLRRSRIFSIDPPTARDLDDALSIRKLPDGNFEVGVHIADVTFFVRPGTALDEEAKRRATTVYLVTSNMPMLPRMLSEKLTSLQPGTDRLAMSVIWIMTPEGKRLKTWFGRSIIRNCCQLDYNTAQRMLEAEEGVPFEDVASVVSGADAVADADAEGGASKEEEGSGPNSDIPIGQVKYRGPSSDDGTDLAMTEEDKRSDAFYDESRDNHYSSHDWTLSDLAEDTRALWSIAKKLREKRYKNGSLSLDQVKLWFELDKACRVPVAARPYAIKDANRLIEEFMLLANISVAELLCKTFPNRALLRRHDAPDVPQMVKLRDLLQKQSIKLDIATSGSLNRSLERIIRHDHRPYIAEAVHSLLIKPMQPAKYLCTDKDSDPKSSYRHYALNFPLYTHFTSPIRRYADVVVHRLLLSYLSEGAISSELSPDDVKAIAENCNQKKMNADKAQQESDVLFLCMLLSKTGPQIVDGVVNDVMDRSISILAPKYGVEGRVYFEDLPLAKHEWKEKEGIHSIVWKRGLKGGSQADLQAKIKSGDGGTTEGYGAIYDAHAEVENGADEVDVESDSKDAKEEGDGLALDIGMFTLVTVRVTADMKKKQPSVIVELLPSHRYAKTEEVVVPLSSSGTMALAPPSISAE